MIQIDRMSMNLPAGFQHRATSIALLVGQLLSKQSVSPDVSLKAISIKPQKLSAQVSDTEIAQQIVNQIASAYEGGQL
ncbi:MAG: hypothetical protein GY820_45690 [Gammaproteobacteria bacterium]|nr:hypothetical protein [Gammaproteobacteria bacterium]